MPSKTKTNHDMYAHVFHTSAFEFRLVDSISIVGIYGDLPKELLYSRYKKCFYDTQLKTAFAQPMMQVQ